LRKNKFWFVFLLLFVITISIANSPDKEKIYIHSDGTSESMYPTLNCNYSYMSYSVDKNTDIKIGDIVIYENPYNKSMKIRHRVIEKIIILNKTRYILKGDNNKNIDQLILNKEDILYITDENDFVLNNKKIQEVCQENNILRLNK